jgi:MoaA/NifB/PqqE/SkfB family radical SAM enzyme
MQATLRRVLDRVAGTGLRHSVYRELGAELEGLGDDRKALAPLLSELDREGPLLDRYQILTRLLDRHPRPARVNFALCMEEYRRGIDELRSYPPYVFLDISSICSVECRFCKYTHKHLPKEIVTLDEVRAIEWMKYVRLLNLTSGTAEALTNPQFIDIFDYLRGSFPDLHISFLTNGRTLKEKVLRALAGRLDALHVSMNASSESDYDRIIANGSWKDFDASMSRMKEIFRGHARPKLTASFVMMRWNLERQLANLDYAVDKGATQVLFHHFYPHYIRDLHQGDEAVLREKFGVDDSLYFEKERADAVIQALRERGAALGVEVITPPAFAEPSPHIHFGVRSGARPPQDCIDPWTKMYLLWGFKSRREEVAICCGLATDIGVYFERDAVASREGLLALRNHPTLRAYRRTVNGGETNPICRLCRKIDRFDPRAVYPDQRSFFEFNQLPIPPHLELQPSGSASCAP